MTASLDFILLSLALVGPLLCLGKSTAQKKEVPTSTQEMIESKDPAKESTTVESGICPFSEIPCFGGSCSMSCTNQGGGKKNHSTEDPAFCPGSEIDSSFIPFFFFFFCKVGTLAEVISKYPPISINSEYT